GERDSPAFEERLERGLSSKRFPEAEVGGQVHDLPSEAASPRRAEGHLERFVALGASRSELAKELLEVGSGAHGAGGDVAQPELAPASGVEQTGALLDEQRASLRLCRRPGRTAQEESARFAPRREPRHDVRLELVESDAPCLGGAEHHAGTHEHDAVSRGGHAAERRPELDADRQLPDRKSTRLNSSHVKIADAVVSVKKT